MGLDQYAKVVTGEEQEEIAYWRKHPNLQGFMETLYHEKGGDGEFNCVDVELELEDIRRLEDTVMAGHLPPTAGFFFGSDSDDHYTEQDLEFCSNAREALKSGKRVIYYSWW